MNQLSMTALAALAILTACGEPYAAESGRGPHAAQGACNCQCPVPSVPETAGEDTHKATVREYIRKLMNEPRQVRASQGHAEETRGGPGNFEKLSAPQVDEFVAAIIAGGDRFMPASLKPEEKYAAVAVEISAESAFQPGTSGLNPNPVYGNSVGVLQFTTSIWLPLFKDNAKLDGLTHYDGSPWAVKDTTEDMVANHIFENVQASLWCITEQGRRGAPEWLGGPDGPCPKTLWIGQFCWVAGAPAAAKNDDPSNQRDHYRAMLEADLALLGLPASILDTPF